jgi:hypothetical protein
MLEKLGAESILAVEANTHAYLKCLIVKEALQLQRTKFLCGDFVQYLQNSPKKFDICWASGVLYHMANPVDLISLISEVSDSVFLWTHYFDGEIIAINPNLAPKFDLNGIPAKHDGFSYIYHRQEYKTDLQVQGFCGGSQAFSNWMSREEIISCLNFFGFNNIKIDKDFDMPNHPHGPAFSLVATKLSP